MNTSPNLETWWSMYIASNQLIALASFWPLILLRVYKTSCQKQVKVLSGQKPEGHVWPLMTRLASSVAGRVTL